MSRRTMLRTIAGPRAARAFEGAKRRAETGDNARILLLLGLLYGVGLIRSQEAPTARQLGALAVAAGVTLLLGAVFPEIVTWLLLAMLLLALIRATPVIVPWLRSVLGGLPGVASTQGAPGQTRPRLAAVPA